MTNPWVKKVAEKRNPWTAKLTTEQLIARRERIRQSLFDAGWKPADYMLPITDDKIRAIMGRLHAADIAVTERRIQEIQRAHS